MSTALYDSWSSLWTPPQRLSLSEWVELYLILSSEYSARSGPIKLFQFQKEIFDAFTDPNVREIVCMCATQMTKTILLQAIVAYTIVNDPLPILLIQPKDDAAKKFSKRRITPMLRDCPILAGRVSDSGAGHDTTIQEKTFPGGSLSILGAGSPTNLASASIAIALLDEVDKFEANVGGHGDPIMQIKARLSTYGSRSKLVKVCSPTTQFSSRIARDYEDSDQRQAWVPCHACKRLQVLSFTQVRWDNTLPVKERPRTAQYECVHCDARWSDLQRRKACEQMEWRALKPFNGVAGFHLSHLYSPWRTLSDIVSEFLRVKDTPLELQTFTNNTLAELWKVEGQAPDEEKVFARRETYPFGNDAIIPRRACFLTASVDIQHDRLEAEVVAWGRNRESWSVAYEVIQPTFDSNGKQVPYPITAAEVWEELDRRILRRNWQHENGGTLPVWLMVLDSGYNAKLVYDFCLRHTQCSFSPAYGLKPKSYRSVAPVKGGTDEYKLIEGVSNENAARKRQDIRVVTIGTPCAKSELYDNLRNVRASVTGEAVANCLHFPSYNMEYFQSLCSEQRLIEPSGKRKWVKKHPNGRNEALDLKVYNRAAAVLCGIDRFTEADWDELEKRVNNGKAQPAPAAQAEPSPTPQAPPAPAPRPQPQRRMTRRLF
jgi:phage terminase large subunit GpA-like protein